MTIKISSSNGIGLIEINRPQYRNAFGETTYQELIDAFQNFEKDDAIKVITVTGVGKHFSAGGDINHFKQVIETGQGIPAENILITGELVKSIQLNSKPVIGALNGFAAGAGAGLALACDFLVMTESSQIITAFIQMAFPGDTALIYNLEHSLGPFRTRRHLMLNEAITSQEAYNYGLAYEVVSDQDLQLASQNLAEKLKKQPPKAIAYQKKLIASLYYPEITEFNKLESIGMRESSLNDEHKEAVQAFLEKRAPNF